MVNNLEAIRGDTMVVTARADIVEVKEDITVVLAKEDMARVAIAKVDIIKAAITQDIVKVRMASLREDTRQEATVAVEHILEVLDITEDQDIVGDLATKEDQDIKEDQAIMEDQVIMEVQSITEDQAIKEDQDTKEAPLHLSEAATHLPIAAAAVAADYLPSEAVHLVS